MTLAGKRAGRAHDDGADSSREYAIKAAYLYQFGRYVQWPAARFPTALFAGDRSARGRPFGGILEEIAGTKHFEGRRIAVRRFASMAEYAPCHVLFVVPLSPRTKRRW